VFILAAVICAALSAVSCTEDTNYDEINDKKTALIEYGQALKSLIVPWELWDDDACDGSRLQRSSHRQDTRRAVDLVRLIFSGNVVDQDHQPIPGLKVEPSGWLPDGQPSIGDPVLTDQDGNYRFDLVTKPWGAVCISVRDIDGPENGSYLSNTAIWWMIDYSNTHLEVGDDTWDFGTVTFKMPRIILIDQNPK